jgi:hypothetical protein
MPLSLVGKHYLVIYIGTMRMQLPCWPVQIFASQVPILTTWDLYIIALFAMFSSGFGMLLKVAKHPIRFIQHFAKATGIYVSIMLSSALSMFLYLIGREARFFVTGAKADARVQNRDSQKLLRRINFTHPVFICTEYVVSISMLCLSIVSLNLWLFGLCLPLVMSPIMQWRGSEGILIKSVRCLSPISIVLALVLISFNIKVMGF